MGVGVDEPDELPPLEPPFVMAPIMLSPIFPISGPNGSVVVVGTVGLVAEGFDGRLAAGFDGNGGCPVTGIPPFPLPAEESPAPV
jgi:hypothetical protein